MAMRVQELRELLTSTTPGSLFSLTDERLGVDGVKALFGRCLPDRTLTVQQAQPDAAALRVSGTMTIEGLVNARVTVSFTAATDQTYVTGLLIKLAVTGWEIKTRFLTLSAPFLEVLKFDSMSLLLDARPGADGTVAPALGLEAGRTFQAADGPKQLLLSALLPEQEGADYCLEADFENIHLSDLNALSELVSGGKFDIIPTDLVPLAEQLNFKQLRLVINPILGAVMLMAIEIESAKPWPIIPGKFEFERLGLSFVVIAPTVQPAVKATLTALLKVGDQIHLATGITVPDLCLMASLQEPVKLGPIIAQYLPGVVLDEFDVDTLDLSLDVRSKSYSGSVAISSNWQIVPKVTLADLALEISGRGTDAPSGSLKARVAVGGVDLLLGAAYTDAETGWSFTGGTVRDRKIEVGQFAQGVADSFGVALPDPVRRMTLENVALEVQTGKKRFFFTCTGGTSLAGVDVHFTPTIELKAANDGSFEKHLSGELRLGSEPGQGGAGQVRPMRFTVAFDSDPDATTISATWVDDGKPLQLGEITGALGLQLPAIPESLDLALTGAGFSYDFKNDVLVLTAASKNYGKAVFITLKVDEKRQFFFDLGVDKEINLSNLPLVGQELAKIQTVSIDNLQVIIGSQAISEKTATVLNKHIPKGYPTVPAKGTGSRVSLGAQINFGGEVIPLGLGAGGGTETFALEAGESAGAIVGQSLDGRALTVVTNDTSAADGTCWFNLQKSFGPVTFNKVGVRYADGVLWFLLSASLSVGGLAVEMEGLAVGSPLDTFSPHFDLDGMGIAYMNPPLEIGGAFLRGRPEPPVTLMFSGAAVIKAQEFGLTAFGSYADISGKPSMFIFAMFNGAIGGPPYFFVTGFMGGFGFNSHVRAPRLDEIYRFPFIAGLTNPSAIGGKSATPLQALSALTSGKDAWVTPRLGDLWLAAGIMFTTFKTLDSKALVMVEVGHDLTLSLIGLMRARFPQVGPLVYAQLELQLQALFQPIQGVLAVGAALSPNSFLLDPSCKITGGVAFCLWFGASEHAGDFVFTVGGYSPHFEKPAWYPTMQPVGFNWSIDAKVSVTGGAYLAFTPSCIMVGGGLGVVFDAGNLKAWFTAHADLIVWYMPFHFQAEIGVTVGASYRLGAAGVSKTFQVELGAGLHLWGPPTGGTVTVHWWVISFTVDFGAKKPAKPPVLTWDQFTGLLPDKGDVVKIRAVDGLAGEEKSAALLADGTAAEAAAGADSTTRWIVRAGQFRFATSTAIPAYQLFLGSGSATPFEQKAKLSILPMQKQDLASALRLTVRRIGHGEVDLVTDGWRVTAESSNVPKAMWGSGDGSRLVPGDQQLVEDQLTGLTVTAPEAKLGPSPGEIDAGQELGCVPLAPNGQTPLAAGQQPVGPAPRAGQETVRIIGDEIMADSTKSARDDLFAALRKFGADPATNEALTNLAGRAGALFEEAPLIVPTQGA